MKRLPAEEVSSLLAALVNSLDIFKDKSVEDSTQCTSVQPPAILLELLSARKDTISPQAAVHVVQALVTHLPEIIDLHHYTFASQILQSTICLFVLEPASFQHILGRALHICVECGKTTSVKDPDHYLAVLQLNKQAKWYYHLLKCDPSAALAKRALGIVE